MQIVSLGERRIGIAFVHTTVKQPIGEVAHDDVDRLKQALIHGSEAFYQELRVTCCHILDVTDPAEPKLISKGTTECVPPDNFQKALGRFKSLSKALGMKKTMAGHWTIVAEVFNRDDREKIWDAYWSQNSAPVKAHRRKA